MIQNNVRSVCVYYEELGAKEDKEVLRLCQASWERFGWKFVVATKDDAKEHPQYDEFVELVRGYPTVNQRAYELACYVRWLAFKKHAPALFSDYDIINFGLSPVQVQFTPPVTFLSQVRGVVPIFRDEYGVDMAVNGIVKWDSIPIKVFGEQHISDMYLTVKGEQYSNFPSFDVTADFGDEGYHRKPLVHFLGPRAKNRRVELIKTEFQLRDMVL